jgi:hypothetical protein
MIKIILNSIFFCCVGQKFAKGPPCTLPCQRFPTIPKAHKKVPWLGILMCGHKKKNKHLS